ncbi:MAG: DUF2182 domain-containing protein [Gemmatimonadota bacterium]
MRERWVGAVRSDRFVVLVSLAAVAALAWIYLAWLAADMAGGSSPMDMVRIRSWPPSEFVFVFLMWTVMMVGMMIPSALPMVLVYAGIVRKAKRQGSAVAPTFVFVGGYLFAWTLFSAVATIAQWSLDQAALLSPMMVASSPAIGAALLVVAGVYQLTPFKDACLAHCRSPAHFLAEKWRKGLGGAFRLGIQHGFYCLGCCWALMLLLFVGGVMNLLWIAAIAFFVLLEKTMPGGRRASILSGGALIAAGLLLLWRI